MGRLEGYWRHPCLLPSQPSAPKPCCSPSSRHPRPLCTPPQRTSHQCTPPHSTPLHCTPHHPNPTLPRTTATSMPRPHCNLTAQTTQPRPHCPDHTATSLLSTPSHCTWKEHISVSSTLIMAPALSNSPQ